MKIESLEQIEQLVQLLVAHKLDMLEVDNIKIIKSKHEFTQLKTPKPISDDELLFEHEKWGS